jgi:hypothetical protein
MSLPPLSSRLNYSTNDPSPSPTQIASNSGNSTNVFSLSRVG